MNQSEFDGGLAGLIGMGILMFLISFFTLSLGTPFAICLYHRWEAKHTIINGQRLKFVGSGFDLIGQWLKWLLLIIITFGIYGFWVSIKMKQWIVRNTVFDN